MKLYEIFLDAPIYGNFAFSKNRDPNDRRESFYSSVNFRDFIGYLEDPGLDVFPIHSGRYKQLQDKSLLRKFGKDLNTLFQSFLNDTSREKFVNLILQILSKLTEKPAGALVPLNEILNDQLTIEVQHWNLNDTEPVLIIWFLFLSIRGVELPTPFHFNIKAFEVTQDLIHKLTQI